MKGISADISKLHSNQRLLANELLRRGVRISVLSRELELIEASYGKHKELILDRDSSITPYSASVISGDKYLTKMLLRRAGLSVVKGEQFDKKNISGALAYAQMIGFPVVVKPVFGSHGDHVHMDLINLVEVKSAIDAVTAAIGDNRFIVEEQFEGKEFRVFVTRDRGFAVLHRDPAHVIGDGRRSIQDLVKLENKKRKQRKTCLCQIIPDVVYLGKKGMDIKTVPLKGQKTYVRHNSNVATGATCEDYTDQVHSSVIDIARSVLDVIHGLPYAGVDFMTKDAKLKQTKAMYRILEVNSVPGINMHMNPSRGKARDVAGMLADMIFPETEK